jgi:hypothetical protein
MTEISSVSLGIHSQNSCNAFADYKTMRKSFSKVIEEKKRKRERERDVQKIVVFINKTQSMDALQILQLKATFLLVIEE